MASVYKRGNKWYLRFKDETGRWRSQASTARTKTEARKLAGELERRAERQRHGLEELPPEDGGGTLAALLEWWLDTYSKGTTSHGRNESAVRRNLINTELGTLHLVDVTSGKIETYLQSRAGDLSPQTLNHLRRFLVTAFNKARQAGRWTGTNPALAVPRRRVPKRLPDFLRVEEVPLVLQVLSERHRPLFATAIYTGMRKGELLGLRKSDVDFATMLITIERSYTNDTTKGKAAATIPIAAELAPYLKAAMERSTSDLVFPKEDGEMMRSDTKLEAVLRRALGRAGIVRGYVHVCRKKGCGYKERAEDNARRRCPEHGHLLWPKADVRKIRFHDLRHTTASLLLMSGANPASVQRILRHADPRITTEVYGHLLPEYLRDEVNRLSFGSSSEKQPVADGPEALVTSLLQEDESGSEEGSGPTGEPEGIQPVAVARHAGFEPAAFGSGVRNAGSAGGCNGMQVVENPQDRNRDGLENSQRVAGCSTRLVTSLLQGLGAEGRRFLTVKEVAAILGVSTATVYAMVKRGELEHVRASNSIRIVRMLRTDGS